MNFGIHGWPTTHPRRIHGSEAGPSPCGGAQLRAGEDDGLGAPSSEEAATARTGDRGPIANSSAVRMTGIEATSSSSIGSSATSRPACPASMRSDNVNGSNPGRNAGVTAWRSRSSGSSSRKGVRITLAVLAPDDIGRLGLVPWVTRRRLRSGACRVTLERTRPGCMVRRRRPYRLDFPSGQRALNRLHQDRGVRAKADPGILVFLSILWSPCCIRLTSWPLAVFGDVTEPFATQAPWRQLASSATVALRQAVEASSLEVGRKATGAPGGVLVATPGLGLV